MRYPTIISDAATASGAGREPGDGASRLRSHLPRSALCGSGMSSSSLITVNGQREPEARHEVDDPVSAAVGLEVGEQPLDDRPDSGL